MLATLSRPSALPLMAGLRQLRTLGSLQRPDVQAALMLPDQISALLAGEVAVQVSATNAAAGYPLLRAAVAGEASAPIVDLTQLAVAQTDVKITAAAGAALGQATGELTGVLVNISA